MRKMALTAYVLLVLLVSVRLLRENGSLATSGSGCLITTGITHVDRIVLPNPGQNWSHIQDRGSWWYSALLSAEFSLVDSDRHPSPFPPPLSPPQTPTEKRHMEMTENPARPIGE